MSLNFLSLFFIVRMQELPFYKHFTKLLIFYSRIYYTFITLSIEYVILILCKFL